jgi:hypothetical protein
MCARISSCFSKRKIVEGVVINTRLGVSLIGLFLVLCLSPISAAQAGICNSPCYSCVSAGDLGIGPFNGGNGVPPWAQLLQLNDAFGLGGSFTVFLIRTAKCAPTRFWGRSVLWIRHQKTHDRPIAELKHTVEQLLVHCEERLQKEFGNTRLEHDIITARVLLEKLGGDA